MKVTLDWIQAKFNEFNQKYFNGGLPAPEMRITDEPSSTLGAFSLPGARYNRRTGEIFKMPNNGVLSINNYYDRDEKSFEETLLHEMVHEYIYVVRRVVTQNLHGKLFYSVASPMISDGYNISETNEITREKGAGQQGVQGTNQQAVKSVLCVLYRPQSQDYKYWYCKAGENEIKQYFDRAKTMDGVVDVNFFECLSPGFANLKSDISTFHGFGGLTTYDIQQSMAKYFNEDPSLFDIKNMKRIQ